MKPRVLRVMLGDPLASYFCKCRRKLLRVRAVVFYARPARDFILLRGKCINCGDVDVTEYNDFDAEDFRPYREPANARPYLGSLHR